MKSLSRAMVLFSAKKLDPEKFAIGHLTDEAAKLYGRDLFLIGKVEESKILLVNDKTRYTAILKKESGQAIEVLFDLPSEQEMPTSQDVRGRTQTTQIPY